MTDPNKPVANLPSPASCPACRARAPLPFVSVAARHYWRCPRCAAAFLSPHQLPSRDEERRHYALHENDQNDPGYRRFLARLTAPLLTKLEPGVRGLDFGCGPGPALAAMLREAGQEVRLYDPVFFPDTASLAGKYDFITCTETAEHWHEPAVVFDLLDELLSPGGWLAVMTGFMPEPSLFASWHYRRDPTHVVFYSEATFRHIAGARCWRMEIPRRDVVLMQKPGAPEAPEVPEAPEAPEELKHLTG